MLHSLIWRPNVESKMTTWLPSFFCLFLTKRSIKRAIKTTLPPATTFLICFVKRQTRFNKLTVDWKPWLAKIQYAMHAIISAYIWFIWVGVSSLLPISLGLFPPKTFKPRERRPHQGRLYFSFPLNGFADGLCCMYYWLRRLSNRIFCGNTSDLDVATLTAATYEVKKAALNANSALSSEYYYQ